MKYTKEEQLILNRFKVEKRLGATEHVVTKDELVILQERVDRLNKELGDIGDPQTKDLSRMYYVPGQYEGAYNFIFNCFTGIVMNPYDIMAKHDYVQRAGTLFDHLPPELRRQLLTHRKNEMTNTNVSWSNYKDCPFFNKFPRHAASYKR